VGEQLAALAQKNGWVGVVVNGRIRDFRPGHYRCADADDLVGG
jgi:regulator of ribonuclease E activity RraA/HMG-CHA aldolase family protein